MSQHRFQAQTSSGRRVEVTIGYDRPLHGFFLVVMDADENDADDEDVNVYCNLDDVELIDLGGLTLDLQYFKRKLALLGIGLAPTIEHELEEDRRQRVGNRVRLYDGAGQVLAGSGV